MAEALRANDVVVRCGARALVDGVSLRVSYGAVTALIGPNGAGKSTLLRALLGLTPSTGTIWLAGASLRELPPAERARRVAYVPQHSQLAASVRVDDVVRQGRFSHGGAGGAHEVDRALVDAEVAHLRARTFNTLSGGEQRRVLLARALATEARVLLLDEPTAGLDVGHVLRFHRLMRALAARGYAVLTVLHDLLDVQHFADSAVLLHRARVVAAGPVREVLTGPTLAQIYGVRLAPMSTHPFELSEAVR